MEINWSTFALEIVNFLVLVWILKRFLYSPIKRTIEERKKTIQKNLQDAEDMRNEAKDLQQKYENRLADWNKVKATKKSELQHELLEEKNKLLQNLEKLIDEEKEKHRILEKRRIMDIVRRQEKTLIGKTLKFTSRLLSQFASQELESKIIDLFIGEFQGLPKGETALLKREIQQEGKRQITIKTAFMLEEAQKNKLIAALQGMLNYKCTFHFEQDQSLLAGAYIELWPLIFQLNLRDELKFFAKGISRE